MTDNTNDKPLELNEQMQLRRDKLEELRERGEAYPNGYERDAISSDIVAEFEGQEKEAIAEQEKTVTIAGRIMTRRLMGKASFVHLQDVGTTVAQCCHLPDIAHQVLLRRDPISIRNRPRRNSATRSLLPPCH